MVIDVFVSLLRFLFHEFALLLVKVGLDMLFLCWCRISLAFLLERFLLLLGLLELLLLLLEVGDFLSLERVVIGKRRVRVFFFS
jgi:hypothetical protein